MTGTPAAPTRRLRPMLLLPLVAFAGLALLFLVQLQRGGDPSAVPSAIVGRPAPVFALSPLDGLEDAGRPVPGLATADLAGRVTLVDFWASWCAPCRQEHPFLLQLSSDPRLRIVGINYKDQPENARRFLGQLGNPFAAIGRDDSGRTAIDWGVYGVPESFLVGADGIVRYKFIGPISAAGLPILNAEIDKAAGG
jgi:cytochrome c biogenesis protein CcmG/thiol:disulfide interchange protein DsbE